jgi:transcription initiation factor TFIIIB Brf1 subunit/transcription initiation factor TFIIB
MLEGIFNSETDPFLIAEAFQKSLFLTNDSDDDTCTHNIKSFPDGNGYCVLCGLSFNDVKNNEIISSKCSHGSISKDDTGMNVCCSCGKEFESLDYSQEWRNFGVLDNRSTRDQSRCHNTYNTYNTYTDDDNRKQKTNQKSIKNVFDSHSITLSTSLLELVEAKFNHVLKVHDYKVVRGQGREAIIACCLFHAYQIVGEDRTTSYIRNLFGINQKSLSAAMAKYYKAFPDDTVNHMTPERLIPWIMKMTGVGTEHYVRIISISKYLSSTSSLVERSNPQSVAAATIYFYLCLFPMYKEEYGLTKTKFAEKAKLSDITITKIVANMAEISKIAAEDFKKDIDTAEIIIKPKKKKI